MTARAAYRYRLERHWSGGEGLCAFIMLNPSTADARSDDPTIRRCIGFARRWGYGGLLVANLFARRATDPQELFAARDPVGGLANRDALLRVIDEAALILCAWGAFSAATRRGNAAIALVRCARPGGALPRLDEERCPASPALSAEHGTPHPARGSDDVPFDEGCKAARCHLSH